MTTTSSRAGRGDAFFSSIEATVLVSFLVSLLLLLFGAGLIKEAAAKYLRAETWVSRVQEVRAVLPRLDTNVSDAALALQGFLHSGDAAKLQEWSRLTGEIGAHLAILEQLMGEDPAGKKRLADLRTAIERFLNLLDTSVFMFNAHQLEEARGLIYSGSGFTERQAIRSQIDAISATAQQMLDDRQLQLKADWKHTGTMIALTLLMEAVVLGLVFWHIRREMVKRRRAQSAQLAAVQAADAANRAKSTFLAAMSHEVRTPMNGVLGLLELLSLGRLDAEQRDTLRIARESSHALLRVLDDILDFSKIEAGKLDLRPEPASLVAVVEGVRNMFAGNASSKGLLLKHSIDPRLSPVLLMDPVRVRQILNNLVSNAIKFTSQGAIDLRAELVERVRGTELVRFTVRDTGIGISQAEQNKLFQPFQQASGAAAARPPGTGLGLTICRRLASMMGGTVEMHSEPGQGTAVTLTLSLPIGDPTATVGRPESDDLAGASDATQAAPSIDEAEREGSLVLVVDDHPTNRLLLMRQMNVLGYAAESVENGVQALEQWQTGRFGLVLTDCNMPEMDGYELARRIRQIEGERGGTRTPIVACTAYALKGEADTCMAAGMDDYLAKPIVLGQLAHKLKRWLPRPNAIETRRAVHAAVATRTASEQDAHFETSGPAAQAPPLDVSRFVEVCGGNFGGVCDTLREFRRINNEDAAQLRLAVQINDLEAVTRFTHRMLGASGMAGADRFAAACRSLNDASRAGHTGLLSAGMVSFERELVLLNSYVDSYVKRAAASPYLSLVN